MASDNQGVEGKPAKSSAGDGFVMLTIALVTLALCLGLVLHVGLSLLLAVAVSAAFCISLLTLHRLSRRQDQLEELKGEVESLKAELARISPPGVVAAGARARANVGPALVAEAPLSAGASPQPASPAARIGDVASDRLASALKPSASAPGSIGPTDEVVPPLPGSIPARAAGISSSATTSAPQVPQVVRAPQPAAARAGATTPAAFGFRPGERPADTGPSAGPPAASQREPDVESIQGLIRKLADEVDASTPAQHDQHGAAATMRQSEIDRSIGALRSTASTMKDAPSGAPSTASARPAATDASNQRKSERGARRTGPSGDGRGLPTSREAQLAPGRQGIVAGAEQDAGVAGAPAQGGAGRASLAAGSGGDEDFDVDALVRRAQPIATMTSKPPPLPRAADRTADRNDDRMDAVGTGKGGRQPAAAAAAVAAAAGRGTGGRMEASLERDRQAFEDDTAAEMDAISEAHAAEESQMRDRPLAGPQADDQRAHALRAARNGGVAETMPWPEETGAPLGADADEPPPPPGLVARDPRLAPIAEAIDEGRVDVFLEPILEIEQQQARHYEVSVRLRQKDGRPMSVEVTPGNGLPPGALALVDELLLRRTAHVAQLLDERGKTGAVFATLTGQALTSDDFLTTFAETFEAQPSLAGQLVLTFSQVDARLFSVADWSMLKEMRDLGFAFALEGLSDLDLDLERFVEYGFKFVKLDAATFLEGLPAPGAVIAADDLSKYLMDEGLVPIVCAIGDEAQRQRIQELGVRFAQGRLFGGPRLMKAAAARSAA